MRIYNTLSRKKEEFVPLEPGKVRIYACGPTVYNYIHIGNARPICVFDVLRRYLEYRGYEVKFVQNFTDIDDKLIKKANEEGITVAEVAERYIAEYQEGCRGSGRPSGQCASRVRPKVVDKIIEIVSQRWWRRATPMSPMAMCTSAVRKFEDYGKLVPPCRIEDLEAGSRVDVSEIKEDPLDFALWKAAKPGEPYLGVPVGQGPSGLAYRVHRDDPDRHLGETIDIHCGGQDLDLPAP